MKKAQRTVITVAALSFLMAFACLVTSEAAQVIFYEGFESVPEGVSKEEALQMTPFGWVVTAPGQAWSVRLSDEMPYDGDYAMEVVVHPGNTPWGVHISSKPIPVEPGLTYTVTYQLFNEDNAPYNGRVDLYIEFWPENAWWGDVDYWSLENWRNQLPGKWDNKSRVHAVAKSSPNGFWAEVTGTGTAPENAAYLTISFWTSQRTLRSHIDNIVLTVE